MLILMPVPVRDGRGGAFPNISRASYNWFPATQRGFAKGAVWMAARFMGGLTPVIWVLLTVLLGLSWRQALWLFAGGRRRVVLVFWLWFRNRRHEHPGANEAERAAHRRRARRTPAATSRCRGGRSSAAGTCGPSA